MIPIHIIPGDELPIYRQIMRQVTDALAGGHLRSGDKLPSQRELAENLVVSPLTVKKAYDELERAGLIKTQRGRGTFVSDLPAAVDPEERHEHLRADARRLLHQAHLGGVDLETVLGLVREVHQEIQTARTGSAGETSDPEVER